MLRIVFRLLWNLLSLPLWPLIAWSRARAAPGHGWLRVDLAHRLVELRGPLPWWRAWFPAPQTTSVEDLRLLLRHAGDDPRVRGLLVAVPALRAGWAACRSLRDVLVAFRAKGKRVVVYLPTGAANRELYVASAADRVVLGTGTTVGPLGLAVQQAYFRGALDRFGLRVEVYARGEYKTAAEAFVSDSMSEPQREQLVALVGAIDDDLVGALSERFEKDPSRARAAVAKGLYGAEEARETGLADAVRHEDEVCLELTDEKPVKGAIVPVRAGTYLARRARPMWRPLRRRRLVAVVRVTGAIREGGPPSPGRREDIVAALRIARESRRIRAVLLYVDSPGGSALASERIHREVVRLVEKKPVVAFFADVAASGGYYVSAPANAIVAQPTTVTGSIGVVATRLVTESLLDRLGVRTETLRTAPFAGFDRKPGAFTPEEKALLEAELARTYDRFLDVVAEGRHLERDAVDRIARGRVWSGVDAQRQGLVDRLGGLDVALDELCTRAGLDRVRIELVSAAFRGGELPPPPPPADAAEGALRAAIDLGRIAREPRGLGCYALEVAGL